MVCLHPRHDNSDTYCGAMCVLIATGQRAREWSAASGVAAFTRQAATVAQLVDWFGPEAASPIGMNVFSGSE
jgi:hypothetical protein